MNSYIKQVVVVLTLASAAVSSMAEIVVVAGPSAEALSKDQLTNLYLGRSFQRKLLDLPEGNPLRDDFYKKATERDSAQMKAVWARVVFTGKGQAPVMLPDAAAIKKALITDPKAIGYLDKSQVDATVKVLMTLD